MYVFLCYLCIFTMQIFTHADQLPSKMGVQKLEFNNKKIQINSNTDSMRS